MELVVVTQPNRALQTAVTGGQSLPLIRAAQGYLLLLVFCKDAYLSSLYRRGSWGSEGLQTLSISHNE